MRQVALLCLFTIGACLVPLGCSNQANNGIPKPALAVNDGNAGKDEARREAFKALKGKWVITAIKDVKDERGQDLQEFQQDLIPDYAYAPIEISDADFKMTVFFTLFREIHDHEKPWAIIGGKIGLDPENRSCRLKISTFEFTDVATKADFEKASISYRFDKQSLVVSFRYRLGSAEMWLERETYSLRPTRFLLADARRLGLSVRLDKDKDELIVLPAAPHTELAQAILSRKEKVEAILDPDSPLRRRIVGQWERLIGKDIYRYRFQKGGKMVATVSPSNPIEQGISQAVGKIHYDWSIKNGRLKCILSHADGPIGPYGNVWLSGSTTVNDIVELSEHKLLLGVNQGPAVGSPFSPPDKDRRFSFTR